MSELSIDEKIEKLQYHVSLLGQTIDYDQHPVEVLVLSMDWSRGDLNKAHDIFEQWDHQLEAGDTMVAAEFEAQFSDELGISYQGLKSVIVVAP